ncbi:hypothetical protein ABID19_000811 [Mesorhizobium robiniae]|uniref:Uncharacterized protein n=1 Tax=Mesorhizobium robiniae TaxID=559315 RepID=A0ABV2GHN5_9HYPH
MFPIPSTVSTLNPMNIYTDGKSVIMTIVAPYPVYAIFDPVNNNWTEYKRGFAYACAMY